MIISQGSVLSAGISVATINAARHLTSISQIEYQNVLCAPEASNIVALQKHVSVTDVLAVSTNL